MLSWSCGNVFEVQEIEFEFSNKSGHNFIISVINLLPQLGNLKALKLSFSHSIFYSLLSSFSKLKSLSELRLFHVKLDSNSKGSIKGDNSIKYTNLKLDFAMEREEGLLCLRKCLSSLKELESLRIEIFSTWERR